MKPFSIDHSSYLARSKGVYLTEDNLFFHNNLIENPLVGAAIRTTSPLIESLLESAADLRDEWAKNAYDDANNQ